MFCTNKNVKLTLLALTVLLLSISLISCNGSGNESAEDSRNFSLDEALASRYIAGMGGPRSIIWMPDGKSFLYRKMHDELKREYLFRYDLEQNEISEVADWEKVEDAIRKLVPEYDRPAMNDVNTAGRVTYTDNDVNSDGTAFVGVLDNNIYLFEFESASVRVLTNDRDEKIWPTFSPDGRTVAFAKDKDLYKLDLASGRVTRLTNRGDNTLLFNGVPDWVYDEEFRLRKAFWWSPDSRKIAFLQFDTSPVKTFPIVDHLETVADLELQQYPKAGDPNSIVRLGILDINSGRTTWVNTGKDADSYIARAGWLPDSSRVWLQWLNRDQNKLELMLANPANGVAKTILTEEDDAWINIDDDLQFIDARTFIWTSERSGFKHIYLYKTDGILERQITTGDWGVEQYYGIDSAAEYVYFQSSSTGPLERQIARASLADGTIEALSEKAGWHLMNKARVGDYYIHTFSNTTTPGVESIHSSDGTWITDFYQAEVKVQEEKDLAYPEFFTFQTSDGAELNAYMLKPKNFDKNKKYPVLVAIYGGPGSQAVMNRFGMRTMNQFLVQQGMIVLRVDNRGTAGRGRDFNRIVHRTLGEYELKDHVDAINYLKTLPYIDGDRIGIFGGSYGGYMTLYCMLKEPEIFKCGVSSYPVTDWRYYDTIYTERYMDRPQDNPVGYEQSSTLPIAGNLGGKLLLIHGMMDNNVHMANSIQLMEKFFQAGKDFDLMIYPRERHGIRTSYRRNHSGKLAIRFLMKHLLGKSVD